MARAGKEDISLQGRERSILLGENRAACIERHKDNGIE